MNSISDAVPPSGCLRGDRRAERETPNTITPRQKQMLRHALDQGGKYLAGRGQLRFWESLAARNLAEMQGLRRPRGLTAFRFTDAGRDLARRVALRVRSRIPHPDFRRCTA